MCYRNEPRPPGHLSKKKKMKGKGTRIPDTRKRTHTCIWHLCGTPRSLLLPQTEQHLQTLASRHPQRRQHGLRLSAPNNLNLIPVLDFSSRPRRPQPPSHSHFAIYEEGLGRGKLRRETGTIWGAHTNPKEICATGSF